VLCLQDGLSASHQGDSTAQQSYSGMLSQQGTTLSTTGTCTRSLQLFYIDVLEQNVVSTVALLLAVVVHSGSTSVCAVAASKCQVCA
jgi:hypothetical protein